MSGFATAKHARSLGAAQTIAVDVTMSPAAVTETVTVSGRTDAFTNSVQGATNLKQELLATLPTSRTLLAAVELAPGIHATGPSGNISIGGAMSFENVYLLNGVQIQDNRRGTPFNLFIEDAIQETTVVKSGVSAEYGRFSGGVVNAVTRSGGNTFSGSFRTTFTNDDWRSVTPFDEPKTDNLVPIYEFTAGGPILHDRTWFFGAGRLFDRTLARQTRFQPSRLRLYRRREAIRREDHAVAGLGPQRQSGVHQHRARGGELRVPERGSDHGPREPAHAANTATARLCELLGDLRLQLLHRRTVLEPRLRVRELGRPLHRSHSRQPDG